MSYTVSQFFWNWALWLTHSCPVPAEAWLSHLPSPPLACTHIAPVCTRAHLSFLIYGVRPIFYQHFFHHVIKILNCSLVSAIYKTVVDFPTALYPDSVCCCLSKFRVNPPQTVTAMTAILAPHACASVPCWSPPKVCRAWARNGALTLFKQTGLFRSNMLRYSTACLVWVLP